ncbi:unnamed protein product [Penicillium camemberti]|uniref:Str. FM013 n=1 Tax=Penicillium camemberti (strain FM 013) TaxID=1429867 RepID=A0A0G4PWL6_PENC3|nr:unnamed protein product [Penicillium camemberti]
MCNWEDKFYQGCGCPFRADKASPCDQGNCLLTTTDPRQMITIVWVSGKCAQHSYLSPSSSENSFA